MRVGGLCHIHFFPQSIKPLELEPFKLELGKRVLLVYIR